MDGFQASMLMRNLSEATPNSSQRPGLVEANSPAVSHNREKRRDTIQHLHTTLVTNILATLQLASTFLVSKQPSCLNQINSRNAHLD